MLGFVTQIVLHGLFYSKMQVIGALLCTFYCSVCLVAYILPVPVTAFISSFGNALT